MLFLSYTGIGVTAAPGTWTAEAEVRLLHSRPCEQFNGGKKGIGVMTKRGGRRQNAGRKPRADGRVWRSVRVPLTDGEFASVKALTPDERREALMAAMKDLSPDRRQEILLKLGS